MPRDKKQQAGLSMIEVLVTITILSIGLLGTAALQIQSKRASLGSVERTLASMLVNDMFERMRANPTRFNVYRSKLDATQYVGQSGDNEPRSCVDQTCTPTELATWDVWDWEQTLIGASEVAPGDVATGGLVLPLACMTGPTGGGEGLYTITINWRGHAEFTDPDGDPLPDPCNANATGRYTGDSGTAGSLRRAVAVSSYLYE